MLRVGFSEVNITPPPGLRMSGMLQPPRAEGVEWPLHARTVVFNDGIDQTAIVSLDLLFLSAPTVAEFREAITAGTGLDPAGVMMACSHTHRGPFTTSLMDEDANFEYLDRLRAQLVEGMARALATSRPARLKVGHIKAPGWTFNRRPVYRGEQVGTQGPAWGDHFVRLEGPADDDLQVLLVEDVHGGVLGGLVDFACHTTVMGGEPVYSADFPGPLTDELAQRLGDIFAYLQGASGNLWAHDLTRQTPRFASGREHAQQMAQALADKACEALATGRYLDDVTVRTRRVLLQIPQRRPTREQVELARWYLEQAPPDVDQKEFTRRMYGHDYTFYNNDPAVQSWFAREAIGMWEWQRRMGTREARESVEIQAIAIGDAAFVGYPVELFCEFGLSTKERSPFADTFVVTLANGWHGYVPTQEAFAHGGYEPRLGYQSRLVPEAGDYMRDAAVKLLCGLARPSSS